jgi:hypothetical protein
VALVDSGYPPSLAGLKHADEWLLVGSPESSPRGLDRTCDTLEQI